MSHWWPFASQKEPINYFENGTTSRRSGIPDFFSARLISFETKRQLASRSAKYRRTPPPPSPPPAMFIYHQNILIPDGNKWTIMKMGVYENIGTAAAPLENLLVFCDNFKSFHLPYGCGSPSSSHRSLLGSMLLQWHRHSLFHIFLSFTFASLIADILPTISSYLVLFWCCLNWCDASQ